MTKDYDYLLKVLLVGDSDVGKHEILSGLEDASSESPFCSGNAYKTTTILLEGKRVKLQLWDTSGQGRFCTIIRSYSRGAQGIILVYDITNKWSFDGIDRWLKEVEEHAPGIPKVLVVLSLQELCCRTIVRRTSVYAIDSLPLPPSVKSNLKSYALTTSQCYNSLNHNTKHKNRSKTPTSSGRNSCNIA
uniref:SOCS box domain-containing protein n=1 Tax=Glossina pallidipes TaxID=7398 RepID=A0A1B0A120_GLOPL